MVNLNSVSRYDSIYIVLKNEMIKVLTGGQTDRLADGLKAAYHNASC